MIRTPAFSPWASGVDWDVPQRWLAATPLAQRALDVVGRGRARRHVVALDGLDAARCQLRTLTGLVRRASATRFGREHDFRRVRTAEDFRRLVPLRTPAELWRDWWRPAWPAVRGATWPGPVVWPPQDATANGLPHVPLTAGLLASHRAAAWTALALATHDRPAARPFLGRFGFVVEERAGVAAPEALAAWGLPAWCQPCVIALPEDPSDDALEAVARQSAALPLTGLAGEPGPLLRLLPRVRRLCGGNPVTRAWPGLAAVWHAGPGQEGVREALAEAVGDPSVRFLEAWLAQEGPVAVEDPRHGLPRLLVDHGVYFEFVPKAEIGQPRPTRHTVAEVEPGVDYAVAMSSPAGVWACLVGGTVRFERRDPPLLRVLNVGHAPHAGGGLRAEDKSPACGACPTSPAHPFPPPAPHPRIGDSPEAPARTPARSPSSARAGRG